MISILIPVYNYDVTALVADLRNQCILENLEYEIIIIDDCSTNIILPDTNLLSDKRIKFERLYINVGRSRIRNLLASKATFNHLLFLDCDSDVSKNTNFIKTYALNLGKSDVQYGGTMYTSNKPEFNFRLHWTYGKEVESPKADIRAAKPFESFKTNNFIVQKSVFEKVRFDETINSYGYEDYKFATELNANGYAILHINNEVMHNGLNENEDFLYKTEISLKTLAKLFNGHQIEETKLIKWYLHLRNWKTLGMVSLNKTWLLPLIRAAVLKFPENITLFQMWKMLIFSIEMKKPA